MKTETKSEIVNYIIGLTWSAIILILAVGNAHATAFDDWAENYTPGTVQFTTNSNTGEVIGRPWALSGKLIVLEQEWKGTKGLAYVQYTFTDAPYTGAVHRIWVAGDVNAENKFSFFLWTPHGPSNNDVAKYGQIADVGSTAAGLASGLSEMNPVMGTNPALLAMGVMKTASIPLLKNHSIEMCFGSIGTMGSMGWGAAAWNIGAIAGLGPIGIVPAIGAAIYSWPDINERFWECVPPTKIALVYTQQQHQNVTNNDAVVVVNEKVVEKKSNPFLVSY